MKERNYFWVLFFALQLHFSVDIGKQEICANFQQKILNSMAVGACQSFQFFIQKTWFLESNKGLSKFLYEVSDDLISNINS